MRLTFSTLVAAATLLATTTPALADRAQGHSGRGGGIHAGDGGISRGEHSIRTDRGDRGNRGGGIYVGEGGIPRGEHRLRDDRDDRSYRDRDRSPIPNTRHHLYDGGRGANYWGPSARPWTRWDKAWGDPHRYARQWGFNNYDPYRGWQRGGVWYATPSAWDQWGGWSWSFSVSGRSDDGYSSYDSYSDRYGRGAEDCGTYRSREWVRGQRATVTFYGCTDQYGRMIEQSGTRRIERWGW